MSSSISPNDRFDADLAEKVASYLVGLKVPTLQKLNVETRGSTVVLRGEVNSHFEKQLAMFCQDKISGIKQVVDEIQVKGGKTYVPAPPPPRGLDDDSRDLRRFGT